MPRATPELIGRYTRALDRLIHTCSQRGCDTSRRPATPDELIALRKLGVGDLMLSLFEAAVLDEMADIRVGVHQPDHIVYENTALGPGYQHLPSRVRGRRQHPLRGCLRA